MIVEAAVFTEAAACDAEPDRRFEPAQPTVPRHLPSWKTRETGNSRFPYAWWCTTEVDRGHGPRECGAGSLAVTAEHAATAAQQHTLAHHVSGA